MRSLLITICLLVGGAAFAAEGGESAPATDSDRPWAEGVSEADQKEAESLFAEANDLLKDAFFTRAVELYRQAIGHWDHPAIHFNLAKALMNLDQPDEAYYHLNASMKFDGRPLNDDQIDQVERYTKILYETELAELAVETDEPGARVTLDGTELFVGPGRWVGVVRPDRARTLIATKRGYQTEQIDLELQRGQMNEFKIEMEEIETSTQYTREFDAWIPWAVIGGGVALLAGGGIMTWQSVEAFDEYDSAVEQCNNEAGFQFTDDAGIVRERVGVGSCATSPEITDNRDSGELFQTLSMVGYIAGGATLATGLVLLYINREQPIEVEMPVSVTPYVGPDRAGVSATIGF